MSQEVDATFDGPFTLKLGETDWYQIRWPQEVERSQWYRLSVSLAPSSGPVLPGDPPIYTNPPGTLLTVVHEQYGIAADEEQYARIVLRNDSDFSGYPKDFEMVVQFSINTLSTPTHE
jgi:hypothetical protein